MIAGGEIKKDAFHENLLRFAPFAVGGGVGKALNGVADGDDEGGIFSSGFFPNLLVNAGLSLPGAVPEDDEMKVGGAERGEREKN